MATAAAIARLTTQRQTFQRRVLSSFEVAGLTGVDGTLHDFGTLGEDEASSSDLVLPMGVAVAVSLDDDWDVGDIAIQDNAGQEVFAKAGVADQIVRVNGFFPGGRIVNVYRGTGAAVTQALLASVDGKVDTIDGTADAILEDTAEIGTATDTDLATDIANAAAASSTAHGTAQADLDIITGAAGVVLDSTAVADIWDYNIDDGDGDDTMSAACAIAIALAYAGNDWAASDSPAIGGVDTLRTTYRDPSDGEDRLVVDRSATSASRTLIAWTCPDGATGP